MGRIPQQQQRRGLGVGVEVGTHLTSALGGKRGAQPGTDSAGCGSDGASPAQSLLYTHCGLTSFAITY